MKLIWSFILIPTTYYLYKIEDATTLTHSLVREFKTRGEALEWVKKEGSKEVAYFILDVYKK